MPYDNIKPISELQYNIMIYVDQWTHKQDNPISQKSIIQEMEKQGRKKYTVINAINRLLVKGYLRRGIVRSNSSYYVQTRRV